MDTLSNVVMKSSDAEIEILLKAWVEAVLRYDALHTGGDCCWWYNERANVSTLAGATWTVPGWAALEEYSTKKAAPKKSSIDKESKRGRVDLYVATHSAGLAFEAKHAWQDISSDTCLSAVMLGMGYARDDANRLLENEGDKFYGITFAVPIVPPSIATDIQERDWLVRRWLDQLQRQINTSYAYVFPRIQGDSFINEQGFGYPGVVLIVQKVKGT